MDVISGPCEHGDYEANVAAAAKVAARLEAEGHEVFCPHTYFYGTTLGRDDILAECLDRITDSDTLHLLPGWQESPGAREEHAHAVALGKQIFEVDVV